MPQMKQGETRKEKNNTDVLLWLSGKDLEGLYLFRGSSREPASFKYKL